MALLQQTWQVVRRYMFNIRHYPISFAFRAIIFPILFISLGFWVVSEFKDVIGKTEAMLRYTIAHIVPTLLHLALGWPTFHFSRWLVNDKATGMKQLMLSMGLQKTAYYLGTTLIILVQILVSTLIFKMVFNLFLLDTSDDRLVEHIIILVSFSIQLTTLILASSALITSRPLTLLILILIGLDSTYTSFYMHSIQTEINDPVPVYRRFLALVTPYQSLRTHFLYISRQDIPSAFPWPWTITGDDNFWDKPSGIVFTMLSSAVVQFLFAIWFDEICPWKVHSAPKSPLFCIGNTSKESEDEQSELEIESSKYFEARSSDREIGIKIVNLNKRFDHHDAVKNLSFEVYSGETTLLLGHNGAGKTTLMDLILGKLAPNRGRVEILQRNKPLAGADSDVSTSSVGVGVCPQESLLDLHLTVEQHLSIFAGIKSPDLCPKERQANIEQVLHDVQLANHRGKTPGDLSGGMKRKLSLGLAFVGNSRVLILDEPSSGLDPDSRKLIWDAIRRYRSERTVLLSTQHMDEADYLGDRVAIMSGGKIVCCGSSVFLMGLFGNGYNLRIDCKPQASKDILRLAVRQFPQAKLSQEDTDKAESTQTDTKTISMTINLIATNETQDQYESRLIGLLRDIEALSSAQIDSFALRSSKMEDVLLNTNKELDIDQSKDSKSIKLEAAKSNTMLIQSLLASSSNEGQLLIYKALVIKLAYSFRNDYKSTILFRLILPTLFLLYLLWQWSRDRLFAFLIGVVSAHFVHYPASERASKFKSMQLMSKANSVTYWLSLITCDMISVLLIIIIANICIPLATFSSIDHTLQVHLVLSAGLFMFGAAAIMFSYVMSLTIADSYFAPGKMLVINFLSMTVSISAKLFIDKDKFEPSIRYVLIALLPHNAVHEIFYGLANLDSLRDNSISPKALAIGFCALLGQIILYGLVLAMTEYWSLNLEGMFDCWGHARKMINLIGNKSSPSRVAIEQPDADVIYESQLASGLINSQSKGSKSLVASSLCKSYTTNPLVVNGLSFTVDRGECFGLLGVNGAGKSTTFSMLVTDSKPDAGQIWALGRYSNQQVQSYRSQLGYDPQSNPSMSISPREALKLMARLRLINEDQLGELIDELLELLDMTEHANKSVTNLSGGTKRKLALGMSLIGSPPLLVLDEPTAGIDPMARRSIWHLLRALRNKNKSSVVISSHAMEECEAICDRIGIMAAGKLACLGSFLHLKSKFAQGCSVRFQFSEGDGQTMAQELATKLEASYPNVVQLADQNSTSSTFNLLCRGLKHSKLFKFLAEIRLEHPDITYIVNDFTLEDVFHTLANPAKA